jgi:hypothetical protein
MSGPGSARTYVNSSTTAGIIEGENEGKKRELDVDDCRRDRPSQDQALDTCSMYR